MEVVHEREALQLDLCDITVQLHNLLEDVNQCGSCEFVLPDGEAVSDWNH